ncbi:MAG TPA: hypothetical protein VK138_10705 [Acidiferrobacterales bacterium]|nr:hypothetical protein [Acidiferrobacterales bacterium]
MLIGTVPFAPLDAAVTVTVPGEAPAVKVTEAVEAVPVGLVVVALAADKDPKRVLLREKLTTVPLATGSPPVATVAVTIEVPFVAAVVGDATTVTVEGGAALMVITTEPLTPLEVAVTVSVPSTAPAVKVTEAVPVPPVVVALGADKVPKPLVREKVTTVPLATGTPPVVTVAVTTEAPFAPTVVGDATTVTVVGGAALMVITAEPLAPPELAVTVSVPSTAPAVKVTEAVPPTVVAVGADKVPKPLVREKDTTVPLATGSPPMVTVAVTTEVPLAAMVVGDAVTPTVVTPPPIPPAPPGGGLLASVLQPDTSNSRMLNPNSLRADIVI